MEPLNIAKQMISFQKQLFENSFKAMTMIQDQTEKIIGTFMGQLTWIPDEGKKAMDDWVKAYKTTREQFKTSVDEGFAKFEDMCIVK